MSNRERTLGATFCELALAYLVLAVCSAAAQQKVTGYNAVYNSSANTVASPAFIDASMFAFTNGTLCSVINNVLTSTNPAYPSTGAVIDARGLPSSIPATNMTCAQNTTPWSTDNNQTILNVPSTILLPATGGSTPTPITISTSWILPSNTHLIGEGENDPASGTPATTIQAQGLGSASNMIQFGNSTLCPSACTGISVEKLMLDGQGGFLNGIVNQYAGGHSWVDHVSLYQLLGTGLLVSNNSNHSGPYSNIIFSTGSYPGNSATFCAQINGLTRSHGIYGLTCKSPTEDAPAAVRLDASNNTIKDVRIVGFYDGILVGSQGTAQSNVLVNIIGDTAEPQNSQTPINVIHVSKNNTVTDLSIMGVKNQASGNGETCIQDDVTGTSLPETSVALYALGEQSSSGGYSRYTTSVNAATWVSGTSPPNGACSTNNGGSLYSNSSGIPYALYLCPAGGGAWLAVK